MLDIPYRSFNNGSCQLPNKMPLSRNNDEESGKQIIEGSRLFESSTNEDNASDTTADYYIEMEMDGDTVQKKKSTSIKQWENCTFTEYILNSYLGPRFLLLVVAIIFGTNFAFVSYLNDVLTPSAAAWARFTLAALVMAPFLRNLDTSLTGRAILAASCSAFGYMFQSLALARTSSTRVAFLEAGTVIVCPLVECFVNKKPLGIRESPETWLTAFICLSGVGVLIIFDPSNDAEGDDFSGIGLGEIFGVLQAVGFGMASVFTAGILRGNIDQVLPVRALQVLVICIACTIWFLLDTLIRFKGKWPTNNVQMFTDSPTIAVLIWTGLVTTAFTRCLEGVGYSCVSSVDAQIILATQPLWAALFASWILDETLHTNDYIGGTLMMIACWSSALKKENFKCIPLGFPTSCTGARMVKANDGLI
eukprot:CAMPEP_0194205416 /NCGR_PEP_ID=MMETSP0156-20130528/4690_1 /TAXON_ID=33649 /ORGANISM="Thalassionema nitzschioides, Strain L26-B" /LENGTH=419 /DNA_ID=CAMNT_0038931677 /DNA_START=1 /DNA_END=1260 /DNA_ORIENTATION=+